jgi:hypothetical protein
MMPALRRQPVGAALALMLLTPVGPALAEEDAVARGEYLVRAGGCFSCHTAFGGEPLAGGRALATPFGTFHSPTSRRTGDRHRPLDRCAIPAGTARGSASRWGKLLSDVSISELHQNNRQ